MSAKKKSVNTPLHLLQQLSHSLLEHLESACSEALVEAEKLLAKLEKQRGKVQDKLHKANQKLQDKAQARARESIAELEELLDTLKARQTETRDYIGRLKLDIEQSLHLAQGVGKVREAVAAALHSRDGAAPQPAPRTTRRAPASTAPAAVATATRTRKTPAKSAVQAPVAAVEAPLTPAAKPARKRSTPAAKPASAPPAAAAPAQPVAAKPADKPSQS